MGTMIKVLIADDHSTLRKVLRLLISETDDIVVTDEASDGQEVIEKLKDTYFDVMVLDIAMPKKTGLEVLRELRSQSKRVPPVLVLSTYSVEECGETAIKEGASGYLTKEEAPEKLIDAIRKVFRNRVS